MPRRFERAGSLDYCLAVVRPALLLAPSSFLRDVGDRLAEFGIQDAVGRHDTPVIFDWIVRLLARQGISNRAAEGFVALHGSSSWSEISDRMARARCPRLAHYWALEGCGYRRSAGTCNTPRHLVGCPVSSIPARKGALAQAAVGLWMFIRDVCAGDIVDWIDTRLAAADPEPGVMERAAPMRAAVLAPLIEIPGTGSKIWSMILAELLLGSDPQRERWFATGASFIAIDGLVHHFLHRTGVLCRLTAEHAYGPACYAVGGCAGVIGSLADRIDAREFNASFPASFPRWVQFAIWQFCAEGSWDVCNGNKVDDRVPCRQAFCPAFRQCDKIALKPSS